LQPVDEAVVPPSGGRGVLATLESGLWGVSERMRLGVVKDRIACLWHRRWLSARGVAMGAGVMVYGRPLVTLAPRSRIVLGDRVVLCSDSRRTALGVTRPVVLRTLCENAELSIGRDVGLSGTVICAATRVTIGDNCLIGANVTIADTDFHPLAAEGRRYSADVGLSAPVVLAGNNFIGANSTILRGVTIGLDAIVGAGSVVTRSIPPGAIAAGNPARVVGQVPDRPHPSAQPPHRGSTCP
jgi:acetyltransferase-like isoleucine patch superfamily enzyme